MVASPDARFDPRWLDVAIHPGGGHLWRLSQRFGRQAAAALVLCGESLDGADAVRAGLAWRCVPDRTSCSPSPSPCPRAAARPGAGRAATRSTPPSGPATLDDAIELEARRRTLVACHATTFTATVESITHLA